MASDLDRLQGTWNVTALELDGRPVTATAIGGARIVIEGNRFTSLAMGATYEGTLELDEHGSPKTFDLLFTAGHAQGQRNLGIYRLDGKRWTICLATRGTKRPTRFATDAGSGIALQTLERGPAPTGRRARSKSSAKVKSVELPASSSSSAAPATVLEGEWAMASAVFDGNPLDAAMVKWCRRVTRGGVTTVLAGPQVMLKATFTIGPPSHSNQIDYLNVEGQNKGKAQAGIFALKGATLQICMAAPGRPRPTEFASRAGDGRSLTVWRKEKATLEK